LSFSNRRRKLSWALVLEKWPYVLLSALSVAITILSVARTWEFGPLPQTSVMHSVLRVGYVIIFYVGRILWPANLSPIYPPPTSFTLGTPAVAFAAFSVVAISAAAVIAARRTRAPLVGWGCYVLALAPTFGILAWSSIIVYDRYVYFPAIGILFLFAAGLDRAWSAAALRAATARVLIIAPMLLVLAAEARGTRTMLHHWRDSVSLWRYVTQVAPGMAESFNGLGVAFETRFEPDAAIAEFQRAIALNPNYSWAQLNLASGLLRRGETSEALDHFARARALLPGDPKTAYMHGVALIQAGRLTEAEAELRRAVDLKPDHIAAISRLGTLLALTGRVEESIAALERTVAQAPQDAHPHLWLGVVLLRADGRERDAIAHLREAVRLAPHWSDPLNQLAWLLATLPDPALRDPEEAVRLARRAVELTGRSNAEVLDTQAAAEAAAGRFDEAVRVANEALRVATGTPGNPIVDGIRARIALYERNTPYIEDPGGPQH
jgi:tetratricopeptide (TPR) repeat protein